METNLSFLAGTALTIGTLHTLAGPDHYLPFVAMSRSRNWTTIKTINIVALCGLGHVLSSIVIGFIGIAAGIALSGIEKVEGVRGNIAAWLLLLFGLAYMVWGLYRLWKKHTHPHDHDTSGKKKMTFWILFTIFIFGPCEPLIPILMYPAAQHNYGAVAYIALLFAITTIATMIIVVLLMLRGISLVKFNTLEKYQHVIAGGTIALCGAGIVFLGL
jgi:nickel/cobalt transporter (NicO) family protein